MPVGVQLFSLGRMTVASTGIGTITLNAAVPGFLTFDLAGCSTGPSGQVVGYAINDIANSECGVGTYYSSSIMLTRGSSDEGLKSTNGDSPINMTNGAQVVITPAAQTYKGPTTTILTTASNGGTGTGTYTVPDGTSWLRVRMVGGGAGGCGAGSTIISLGASGGTTYFGSTSFLFCDGAAQAVSPAFGAHPYSEGGSATIGSALVGIALKGADGNGGAAGFLTSSASPEVLNQGAPGGSSPFGGAGQPGYASNITIIVTNVPHPAATPNTGSGGGSAGAVSHTPSSYYGFTGPGGGAGGYIDVIIPSTVLVSTYAYQVGHGGAGGVSVVSTDPNQSPNGGDGASGQIVIEEHYL